MNITGRWIFVVSALLLISSISQSDAFAHQSPQIEPRTESRYALQPRLLSPAPEVVISKKSLNGLDGEIYIVRRNLDMTPEYRETLAESYKNEILFKLYECSLMLRIGTRTFEIRRSQLHQREYRSIPYKVAPDVDIEQGGFYLKDVAVIPGENGTQPTIVVLLNDFTAHVCILKANANGDYVEAERTMLEQNYIETANMVGDGHIDLLKRGAFRVTLLRNPVGTCGVPRDPSDSTRITHYSAQIIPGKPTRWKSAFTNYSKPLKLTSLPVTDSNDFLSDCM